MKILSVNNAYYIRGGADRYFFDLNALLESYGEEVVPFSVKDKRNFATAFEPRFLSPVDFRGDRMMKDFPKIAGRIFYSGEAKNKIKSLLEEGRPHIAHIHQIYYNISPSILPVLKAHGIPVLQTIFNFELICPNTSLFFNNKACLACKDGLYLRAAVRRCYRKSLGKSFISSLKAYFSGWMRVYEDNVDMFIAPSRFVRDILLDYGFRKEKLVHVHHFVNTAEYKPSSKDSGYFLYFGRLVEGKGLETLIKSMKKIKRAELYLAGDGYLKNKLQTLVASCGLDNVKFLGFQEGNALKGIMAGAMFTVLPSEAYETFGLSIIESFAMAKPAIGSDLGPIPEIIDSGINGLLFKPGDLDSLSESIQRLIDHPQLRRAMGANARAKAENEYSPGRHYRIMKDLYNSFNARVN